MATSEFRQRVSFAATASGWTGGATTSIPARKERSSTKLWMVLDGVTVLGSAILATLFELHIGPLAGAKEFWRGTLIQGRSMGILMGLFCGFAISLMVTSLFICCMRPTYPEASC
jgi:hypothetical protein